MTSAPQKEDRTISKHRNKLRRKEMSITNSCNRGPPWNWPLGYFLRALLKFDSMRRTTSEGKTETLQQIAKRLAGPKQMIHDSPWAGLQELTNEGGAFCSDSCPSQAWSASTLIDVYEEAAAMKL